MRKLYDCGTTPPRHIARASVGGSSSGQDAPRRATESAVGAAMIARYFA